MLRTTIKCLGIKFQEWHASRKFHFRCGCAFGGCFQLPQIVWRRSSLPGGHTSNVREAVWKSSVLGGVTAGMPCPSHCWRVAFVAFTPQEVIKGLQWAWNCNLTKPFSLFGADGPLPDALNRATLKAGYV
jgi:hypothetical protein